MICMAKEMWFLRLLPEWPGFLTLLYSVIRVICGNVFGEKQNNVCNPGFLLWDPNIFTMGNSVPPQCTAVSVFFSISNAKFYVEVMFLHCWFLFENQLFHFQLTPSTSKWTAAKTFISAYVLPESLRIRPPTTH